MDEKMKKLMNAFGENGITLNEDNARKMVNDAMQVQTNANEVEHTSNTGFGAELVGETTSDKIIELAVSYSRLLPLLKGEHEKGTFGQAVSILGRVGLMQGASEWTATPAVTNGTHKVPTGKVTITQGSFEIFIPLSRQILNYSSVKLETYIYNAVGKSAGETIDAVILNADNTSGASNINGAGTPTAYLQQPKGLRKEAIDGSHTVDIGTISWANLVQLRKSIKGANTSDLVMVMDEDTYFEIGKLDEFKDASKNGKSSTINGIEYETILKVPVVVMESMPLTNSSGVVSATATDNVKGSIALFDQSVVQYSFGQDLEIDSEKVLNKGTMIGATVDFGFDLANKKAGEEKTRVVLGINVSV